jgi:hypothetical protein
MQILRLRAIIGVILALLCVVAVQGTDLVAIPLDAEHQVTVFYDENRPSASHFSGEVNAVCR